MTETENRPEETTVPPVRVRPERSKYSHAVAAMIWLVAVLILFQVVAALFLVDDLNRSPMYRAVAVPSTEPSINLDIFVLVQ